MSENVYTMRAGRQMDRARVAQAQADAAERQAAAAVAQAQAAAQVAAIQREAEQAQRESKAAARSGAWSRRLGAVRNVAAPVMFRRDLVLVVAMMVASVGTAVPAQMSYYLGIGMAPWLAVLVTAMSEGAAWAGAAMASKAIEDGNRPTGLYRAITWGAACAAAALNVSHTVGHSVPLAVVLGLASVLGVGLWEAYAHSRSQHGEGRTGEQIRRDLYRRLRFRTVYRRARDLVAAVPGMTPDGAWIIAWRAVHGADPGVTRSTLKRHHRAVKRVADLLAKAPDTADDVTVGALQTPGATLFDVAPGGSVLDTETAVRQALETAFDSARPVAEILGRIRESDPAGGTANGGADAAPDDGTDGRSPQVNRRIPSVRGRSQRRLSKGARAAAAATAKNARSGAAQRDRETARAAYAESVRTGRPIGPTELARAHGGYTESWGRTQIKYVTEHPDEYPALRVIGETA